MPLPIRYGYRVEAERYQPDVLLGYAKLAYYAGFEFIPVSDHFHPWFHDRAACQFSWSWMPAAAALIPKVKFGTIVSACIGRYHPGLIAQAFATMDVIFPGRVFVALGTGEAMNDSPLGYPWPKFDERLERMREAVEILRALWTSDFVNYNGKYFRLNGANLYTKPKTQIPIYIAGYGPKAVTLVGKYGDGYATGSSAMSTYPQTWKIIEATAKSTGRDPGKISRNMEVFVAYDKDHEKALSAARRWKPVLIPNVLNSPIHDPRELESLGGKISDIELTNMISITTSADDLIKRAESAISLGINEIQFHNAGPSEEEFLDICGKEVLPYLKQQYKEIN
jgi:coenzyme F420-dependent glucose-6-phosphate dehydrogenase